MQRVPGNAGFSLVEMMMVIGIIGVLVGVGTISYVRQINQSKVESATIKIEATIKQARQSAIAMRQSRRVVVDCGETGALLDGEDNDKDGEVDEPPAVWIEGKRTEALLYSSVAGPEFDPSGNTPNFYQVIDRQPLEESVTVVDVDGNYCGVDQAGLVFYIEFNSRGQVSKVYFEGQETNTGSNTIAAILHLAKVNESFEVDGKRVPYAEVPFNKTRFADEGTDALERYKVQTIEVVRLTGRTRRYDFGIFAPWPNDQPK
jgi:prepilin-type N-terminal cleavage/methylation domain-containing protein